MNWDNEAYSTITRAELKRLIEHTFLITNRDDLEMLNVGDELVFTLSLPRSRMSIKNAMFVAKEIDMERRLLTVVEKRS